jgi:hypothetical protein
MSYIRIFEVFGYFEMLLSPIGFLRGLIKVCKILWVRGAHYKKINAILQKKSYSQLIFQQYRRKKHWEILGNMGEYGQIFTLSFNHLSHFFGVLSQVYTGNGKLRQLVTYFFIVL